MKGKIIAAIFSGLSILLSCETVSDQDVEQQGSVDLFQKHLESGEIGGHLNPFSLIEHPAYSPVHEVNFLNEDAPVFISKACGYVLVYPVSSMHVEVVNEDGHGVLMAITYCPITRSGIGWNRVVGSDTLLLTASGYLFRDNLMPLDVNSNSIWSQMRLEGMRGVHDRAMIGTLPIIETTWSTVKEYFPSAGVYINESLFKAAETGGNAEGDGLFIGQEFGVISQAVIPGRSEVELFTLEMFPGEISLLSTTVQPGGRVVVAGSTLHHYMVAFQTGYEMEPVEGEFPVIMKDETGTYWTIFGEAVSGKRGGEKLESPVFYTAADWAWTAQFENVTYFNID